jgi:hypothetical protein
MVVEPTKMVMLEDLSGNGELIGRKWLAYGENG